MKKKYIFFWIAITIICVLFFSACQDPEVPVTEVTLNTNELILMPGNTETLIATVLPKNADNKEVKWKSSNPAVATVNENGLVTAKKNGTTTITATTIEGKKTATCAVIVDSDYRRKWVGNWDFTTYVEPYGPGANHDTTYYYSGTITLGTNDELNINYLRNGTFVLKVSEDGELSGFREQGYGKFEGNDKMHIYYRSGGYGGGIRVDIDGIKKKGDKQ